MNGGQIINQCSGRTEPAAAPASGAAADTTTQLKDREMKQYVGTKLIMASPAPSKDGTPGYAVKYPDGYESWSPTKVFEDAYRADGEMNFGHALEMLKAGRAVSRSGWNGKGMFIYLVGPGNYPPATDIAKAAFGGGLVPYTAYLAIKSVNGTVTPWLCSQTDALAEDWGIFDVSEVERPA